MLGESQRKEPMFYYVRMEEMIPAGSLGSGLEKSFLYAISLIALLTVV